MTSRLGDDAATATSTLETMWLIRRFEEAVDDLFARGLMHGTMHLSIGQEASATGTCFALRDDDAITSTHRGHGHCIAKGADLERMMAELLAKETGYCRGRGGSMHIADVATGNLGANGIVAGGIPIAAGAALGYRMQGLDRVVVSFFGDGAANEGAFHEAVNLAAIWKLPVVFLCENNKYGMSFSTEKSFAIENISERALGYGIPGVTVDGNDVEVVHATVSEAVDRARSGGGPTLVEAVTYRWKGHSKSDKNLYRTKEEIAQWRERDPILRFEAVVLERGVLDQAAVEEIRARATADIRTAVRAANAAPTPAPTTFSKPSSRPPERQP
ncbi:thiamine pyrophosphate-dependent dehydrogenase E1 component subunit alpha [Nocardioides mesophilus]|uniref:Thiamine pyrophosphate-dependent dehydrogenase E1 component subunit alpha n=1 Tax=Nocardioides mesophilus TaxID=433659 RepID=A0A7G9RE37_9ACTN|nr:thiamine pyrophosphate-dependent dehydrogenase E1 component subunit alpha [Nocardioides mesophilus]QNN53862.1 thiamine pyrophosphate-dependent dehydrogenase E1 component subunit alpha [Nocardioides mesophilus]